MTKKTDIDINYQLQIEEKKKQIVKEYNSEIINILTELGVAWTGEESSDLDRGKDKKRFIVHTIWGQWTIIFWYGSGTSFFDFDDYFYNKKVKNQHAEIMISLSGTETPEFVLEFSSAAKSIPRAFVEIGRYTSLENLKVDLYRRWPDLVFRDKE